MEPRGDTPGAVGQHRLPREPAVVEVIPVRTPWDPRGTMDRIMELPRLLIPCGIFKLFRVVANIGQIMQIDRLDHTYQIQIDHLDYLHKDHLEYPDHIIRVQIICRYIIWIIQIIYR